MQYTDILRASAENQALINQLRDQALISGETAPELNCCIRYMIFNKTLDQNFLIHILKASGFSDVTDIIDDAANALCAANLFSDRSEAEQKAYELIKDSSDEASCRSALSLLPEELRTSVLANCCCCCPRAKAFGCEEYHKNMRRQSEELELIRFALAYPGDFQALTAACTEDKLFFAKFDTGAWQTLPLMQSILRATRDSSADRSPIVDDYYQNILSRVNEPTNMGTVCMTLQNIPSAYPDSLTLPHIPDMLTENLCLMPEHVSERMLRDIHASGIMAVECTVLNGKLTLLVCDAIKHCIYRIPPEFVFNYIVLISDFKIIKLTMWPDALISGIRAIQNSCLFFGSRILFPKRICPIVSKTAPYMNLGKPTALLFDCIKRLSASHPYDLIQQMYESAINSFIAEGQCELDKISNCELPANWRLLAWYYYLPDRLGRITGQSMHLFELSGDGAVQYSENTPDTICASQIELRFISGSSVTDCLEAFLAISEQKGIQKWNMLAIVKLLPNGYRFVCESGSLDFLFDILHSWAEEAVVACKRCDVELQVEQAECRRREK